MDKKAPSENNQEVNKIQDKLFWDIYSRPGNAAGFLRNFLPPNILKALDLNFLSVDKKSYLSEEYKEHYTDLVVKTRFKGNAEADIPHPFFTNGCNFNISIFSNHFSGLSKCFSH